MRSSFVEVGVFSKVATCFRLNVCWCAPEVCKYNKRKYNDGHDDFLLKCNDCKKHTADAALTASRFSQALSQEIYEQMAAFIRSRSLEPR